MDYFVRPPTSLTFRFEIPIWISHLTFKPFVGQQKSKGFDIHINDGTFKIARKFLNSSNQTEEVIFQNFSFPGNRFKQGDYAIKTRLGEPKLLESVKSLTIKIFATFESSVSCLSNVQIWGVCSNTVDSKKKEEIRSIWTALTKAKFSRIDKGEPKREVQKRTYLDSTSSNNSDLQQNIPSEFLDALTCKRMDVPMLLPCGQYVDRSSLDNYNSNEAKWGRIPNDPFTGQTFTESRKAIFDAKLKSRIDAFVLGVSNNPSEEILPGPSTG